MVSISCTRDFKELNFRNLLRIKGVPETAGIRQNAPKKSSKCPFPTPARFFQSQFSREADLKEMQPKHNIIYRFSFLPPTNTCRIHGVMLLFIISFFAVPIVFHSPSIYGEEIPVKDAPNSASDKSTAQISVNEQDEHPIIETSQPLNVNNAENFTALSTDENTGDESLLSNKIENVVVQNPTSATKVSGEISTKNTKEEKPKKKKIRINARIHAAWKLSHENNPDDPLTDTNEFEKQKIENDFVVRSARFKLSWKPEKWMSAVIQVGDFNERDFGVSLLRDAYIHLSPVKYLEIRFGQFKKPFSRLELRSSGKLRIYRRGPGNELLVDELRYGDRDLGIQFSGRLLEVIKLDYEIGAFNGSGPDISEKGNSKDLVARLKVSPFRFINLGVNASLKFFDQEENEQNFAWSAGADAVFHAGNFRTHLEGIIGLDHQFRRREIQVTDTAPPIMDLLAILSYKHSIQGLSITLALEPVFKIELLDTNTKTIDDQVFVYSPGFNFYFGKFLRLMIQGELTRSLKNAATRYPENELLAFQLCFDI